MLPDPVQHAIQACWPGRSISLAPAGEGDCCRAVGVNGEWTFLFAKRPFASACLHQVAALSPPLAAGSPLPLPRVEHQGDIDGAAFVGDRMVPGWTSPPSTWGRLIRWRNRPLRPAWLTSLTTSTRPT